MKKTQVPVSTTAWLSAPPRFVVPTPMLKRLTVHQAEAVIGVNCGEPLAYWAS